MPTLKSILALSLLVSVYPVHASGLKKVRKIDGAFEIRGSDAKALKSIPLEDVPRIYGKRLLLRDGKLDVCSWAYANEHGLIRRLTPIGVDLSGDNLITYQVEPDSVAIDPVNGRVKFFSDDKDTDIRVVGRARTLHGSPASITAHGDYAFLSNGEGGHNFQVVDGTDAQQPYVCKTIPCGNYARRVHYQNGFVFYGVSFTGLWIIDVSNPREPKKVYLWEPPGKRLYSVNEAFAYKNHLFVSGGSEPPKDTPKEEAAQYMGTFILDIADPARPQQVGKLDGHGYIIHEDRMYRQRVVEVEGEKQSLLDVFSLENPASPQLLWSTSDAGGPFKVENNRLTSVVTRKTGKNTEYFLRSSLNRSAAENALLAEVSLSQPPFNLKTLGPTVFDGNTLYLTNGQELMAIDIGNPLQPKLLGSCWSGPTMAMALGNRKMFCAGGHTYQFGESGVWIIDLSDLSKPTRKGYVPTGGEGQNNWIGLNGKVCISGGEWGGHNWVVDVSNRENPKFLGTYFDRYFNGNNSYNIAVGNYFYMDDQDGTKILDLRVWEKYFGQVDENFRPPVFDTYEYNPEVVKGLMQVRHKKLKEGGRGIELSMIRGSLTSRPFDLPKGEYSLSLRYSGHRQDSHQSLRFMLIDKDKLVYDTSYLLSKGRTSLDENLTLSISENVQQARAHIMGCDVSVDYALLKRKGTSEQLIPNGDFEQAGPTQLQAPGWEVGGPRSQWWGRMPEGMKYEGVLHFEDRIFYLHSGRRLHVFDATSEPAELRTPGGVLLPTEHAITNFCVQGSLLYAISTTPANEPAPIQERNFLLIFDISDLSSPKLVSETHREQLLMKTGQFMPYPPSGWVGPHYGLAVSKGILVCGERYHYKEAYLHVVDVKDPRKPRWLTRVEVADKTDAKTECWGYRVLIQMGVVAPLGIIFEGGRWLYTAEYWSGAKIFDLSNPSRPSLFFNEIWPFQQLKTWEERTKVMPDGFFYMPGYSVNAWCGGEVWGRHMIATRLSHCAVLKVPRVSQSPKKLSIELMAGD